MPHSAENPDAMNQQLESSLCCSLVDAWSKQKEPAIEEVLSASPEWESLSNSARRDLLAPLVRCDIAQHHRQGLDVDVAKLASRFDLLNRAELDEILASATLANSTQSSDEDLLPSRFIRVESIGSGGIGRIYRVFDKTMERQLAVKLLRPELRQHSLANQRLYREALLTGSLQHPGVPPVHEVGELRDGSAFFTMKLVSGRTFGEFIAEQANDDTKLSRLLGVFEQIAQTVAFAHSRGVIHRDLKPQNVMVGEFGEVQVMDWGMAKRLGSATLDETELPAERAAADSSDDDTHGHLEAHTDTHPLDNAKANSTDLLKSDELLTRSGEVIGTPAYMPPEQAQGKIDDLSAAADVFSLGAILFEVLTGQRLYSDVSGNDILVSAASGKLQHSMSILCDTQVDESLRSICLHCIEPDVNQRWQDGQVVASEISAYLAEVQERLRRAELEQSNARVKARESKRRRHVWVGMAAAVLIASLVGLAGTATQWRRSAEAERLANQRLREARETVDDYFTTVAEKGGLLAKSPGTQRLRQELLGKAREYYDRFLLDTADDPELRLDAAEAYVRLGEISDQLKPGTDETIAMFERSNQLARESIQLYPANELEASKLISSNLGRIALTHHLANRFDDSIAINQEAIKATKALLEREDTPENRLNLAKQLHNIGLSAVGKGDKELALENYLEALEFGNPLAESEAEDPVTLFQVGNMHTNIGMLYGFNLGKKELGLEHSERCLELRKQLVELEPDEVEYNNSLAGAHNNLALMLHFNGKRKESLVAFETAADIREEIVRRNPDIPDFREDLVQTYTNLGTLHGRAKRFEKSLEYYEKTAAQLGRLIASQPQMIRYVKDGLSVYHTLASLHLKCGTDAGSRKAVADYCSSLERLFEFEPDNQRWRDLMASMKGMFDSCDVAELLELTKGTNSSTKSEFARKVRALALVRDQRPEEALEILDSLTEPNRESFWLAIHALANLQLPDSQRALDSIEKARKAFSNEMIPGPYCYRLMDELDRLSAPQ